MSEQEILANQKMILENQAKILANQQVIQENQAAIKANQETIKQNQAKLDLILANQERILSLLEKK